LLRKQFSSLAELLIKRLDSFNKQGKPLKNLVSLTCVGVEKILLPLSKVLELLSKSSNSIPKLRKALLNNLKPLRKLIVAQVFTLLYRTYVRVYRKYVRAYRTFIKRLKMLFLQ